MDYPSSQTNHRFDKNLPQPKYGCFFSGRFHMLSHISYSAIRVYFQVINKDSVCLCLSDTSLLPLIAAKAGAKKVSFIPQHIEGKLM